VDDNNFFSFERKRKKLFYGAMISIAALFSVAIYVFFYFQPSVYKSSGKFAVFYGNDSATASNSLQTSPDLTKSIAETVKSRYFLEKISVASGVEFDSKDLDNNMDNIIKANVVTNSNIVNIEFNDKNIDNLNKINDVFLSQLNSSKIIASRSPLITIQTIDPLYTSPESTYPKPLAYAAATFIIIIVAGLLIIFSVTP